MIIIHTPSSGDELRKMIEPFDKGKGPIKKVCKVKLSAVSTYNVPTDTSPTRQLLAAL